MNFSEKTIKTIRHFFNVNIVETSISKSTSLVVTKGYYPLCFNQDNEISNVGYWAITKYNFTEPYNAKTFYNAFTYLKRDDLYIIYDVKINENIYHIGCGCIFDCSYNPLVLVYKKYLRNDRMIKEVLVSPSVFLIKELNDFITKKFIPVVTLYNIANVIITNEINSFVKIVYPLESDFKQDVDKMQNDAWNLIENAIDNKLVLEDE